MKNLLRGSGGFVNKVDSAPHPTFRIALAVKFRPERSGTSAHPLMKAGLFELRRTRWPELYSERYSKRRVGPRCRPYSRSRRSPRSKIFIPRSINPAKFPRAVSGTFVREISRFGLGKA